MFSRLRAAFLLTVFIVWTAIFLPVYVVWISVFRRDRRWAMFYWKSIGFILGLKTRTHGRVSTDAPLLIVANHSSYLDIVVLGSLIQGVFIAKAEVGSWPGISLIAKAGRTVFVNRQRSATGQAKREIRQRLQEKNPLILFPEGTSTDGNRVVPFKSALFSVAEEPVSLAKGENPQAIRIQPVTIAYTEMSQIPMGRAFRPLFAWFGDMELAPHLWHLLGFGGMTADVIFHEVVESDSLPSRKVLSVYCQDKIEKGLSMALSGCLDGQ